MTIAGDEPAAAICAAAARQAITRTASRTRLLKETERLSPAASPQTGAQRVLTARVVHVVKVELAMWLRVMAWERRHDDRGGDGTHCFGGRTLLRVISDTAFAPTPTGPVYAGIPGALPLRFRYVYGDAYRGWPINPKHSQHPVRGSFLDPRGKDDTGLSGYHFGIDVSVDDAHPEPGAPALLSHRVYAVESGRVGASANDLARPCLDRRLEIGHFAYWHVSPSVRSGQQVRAGQQIGWSCLGVWHVHLSEWQSYRGRRVWVNPLHHGGRLAPYTDTAPPTVNALTFNTPPSTPWLPTSSLVQADTSRQLAPADLHGLVELRANIADPQSFLGFLNRN